MTGVQTCALPILNVGDLFNAGFGSAGRTGAEIFTDFMASPTEAIIYGLIFVALTMIIVMGGIGGGIEKVCSVGMPALFVALLICIFFNTPSMASLISALLTLPMSCDCTKFRSLAMALAASV